MNPPGAPTLLLIEHADTRAMKKYAWLVIFAAVTVLTGCASDHCCGKSKCSSPAKTGYDK
jgi:hypothetical protein